jgi:phosphoesterase RecJ-like protein
VENREDTVTQTGNEVPAALLRFIEEGEFFVVAGHKDPDGDCVGSQLVVASVLNRIGKKAVACSAGPFKRPEVKSFEERFFPFPAGIPRRDIRVIVTDCSSLERVGDLPLEGLSMALVDHHASAVLSTERDLSTERAPSTERALSQERALSGQALYLDAKAPSVTCMVLKLIGALGLSPTPEEAELLLFGLCTDTGFFRHLDETGSKTFDAVSRLVEAGASPKRVFAMINRGKSLNSRLLTGLILSRTRPFFGGGLLLSFETYEDVLRYGGESRDSDTIYQLLLSVEGAEAAVLIRQEKPENCTVGLRSKDRIDVASIAAGFGGGGHKNAAGASIDGTIAGIEQKLLDAFAPVFTGQAT